MDKNLLSLFLQVAESPSFADVATKLEVRRSSVSRSIATLERQLGVQLFNRTTRHLALTTAGESLYLKVKPHLTALDAALGSLPEQEEEPSGELRIAATGDIGAVFLPRVVAGFCNRHPRVTVDVRLSYKLVDIVGEGFDVALRVSRGRLPSSGLVARKLSAMDLSVFASPGYLARAGTPRSPEDAADHAWVLFRGIRLPSPLKPPKQEPRVLADDMLFVREAVRSGVGLALLPTFLAQPDLEDGKLVRVLPRISGEFGALHLVHPPAKHVPRKVSAFRDYLLEHLAHHPFGGR